MGVTINELANKPTIDGTESVEIDVGGMSYKTTTKEIAKLGFDENQYAKKDGYYPSMTVGKSDNLVGRGEATPEEFSFRPSAGVLSIEDGTARIKSVKGNSVVWNSIVTNSIGQSGYYLTKYDDGSYTMQRDESVTSGRYFSHWWSEKAIVGHKYLFWVSYETSNIRSSSDRAYFAIYNLPISGNAQPLGKYEYENTIGVASCIATCTGTSTSKISFAPSLAGGCVLTIKKYIGVDLTLMFGAGNEPTTIEEFNARKPYIVDEFAYNSGEIISMNVDAIKSVGNNAYNPLVGYARVVGGKTYNFDGEFGEVMFSTTIEGDKNTIDVTTGSQYTFAENGYVWLSGRDICVCLHHTYEKPITPYEDDAVDLSWVRDIKDNEGNALFHNGLRSAGSAYDEIRYNRTTKKWEAVKRIGEVDLGSLDWYYTTSLYGSALSGFMYNQLISASFQNNNEETPNIICDRIGVLPISEMLSAQVYNIITANKFNPNRLIVSNNTYTSADSFKTAMQGVKLYYELAEPIVVEIPNSENLNLDYRVWDFGTEEAIASVPSAPFRADIVYQFNAVDRIRENTTRVQELERIIAQMQAQMASMIETTINDNNIED